MSSAQNDELPEMLILPQNKMAVLIDEIYYSEFDAELSQHPEIQTVFIVTDSETAYRSMIRTYDGKNAINFIGTIWIILELIRGGKHES